MPSAAMFCSTSVRPLGQRISRRSTCRRSTEPEVLPEVALRQVARACLDFADLCLASRRRAATGRRRPVCCSASPRSARSAPRCGARRRCAAGRRVWPLLVTSRSRSPSLSMSPAASARLTFSSAKPGPERRPTPAAARRRCAAAGFAARDWNWRESDWRCPARGRWRSPDRGRRRCRSRGRPRRSRGRGGGHVQTGLGGRVGKQPAAEIPKQVVRLQLEVRHHEIEAAIAIVVAEVGAHAGSGFAVAGDGDAGQQPDFPKAATSPRCDTGSSAPGHWRRTGRAIRRRRSRRRPPPAPCRRSSTRPPAASHR